jgi:C-3',4' desaturase CrtD
VRQWADAQKWREERKAVFPGTEDFWQKQEMLADVSWDLSKRALPWPPQNLREIVKLAQSVQLSTLRGIPYLTQTMADMAPNHNRAFKQFLDSQLLISAQTTAENANALYGSAALDLPRRGVNHVQGGIGSLAKTLAKWIKENGGEIQYRQEVEQILMRNGRAHGVITKKGVTDYADRIIANVTPWGLQKLLGDAEPKGLAEEVEKKEATWGAFTLYLGLDAAKLPEDVASHQQVIMDGEQPLGEGNSVFISLADEADDSRGPEGKRPATLSTHTAIAPWWEVYEQDRQAYLKKRATYAERMLDAAERAIPGIRRAIELCLPGTPLTFAYYTRRPQGMVGGFPQTSLFSARGPQTGIDNVWLVGDSVFPGQSTAGVTLGAMRVADLVLNSTTQ